MYIYEQLVLGLIAGYSFASLFFGLRNRKNPFGISKIFSPLGSFVWADNAIFGMFFLLTSIFCLFFQEWILFWFLFSVFWAVRSLGEQVYWFLEQFAVTHRNKPSTLWPYAIFKGEETWVIMQIFWQCVAVVAIISSVFFGYLWIQTLGTGIF